MQHYRLRYWLTALCLSLYGSGFDHAFAADGSAGLRSTGTSFISVNIQPHLDILATGSESSGTGFGKSGELCVVSNTDGAGYKVQIASLEDSLGGSNLSLGWISSGEMHKDLTAGRTSPLLTGASTAADCKNGSNADFVLQSKRKVTQNLSGSLTFIILPD